MKTAIQIDRVALRAVLRCAAKNDIRYYLNGVLVEASATETILVATDGHRLAAIRRETSNESADRPAPVLIIPRDVVEKLVKFPAKAAAHPLTLIVGEGGELSRIVDGYQNTEHRFEPVEGQFPQWRRVTPDKPSHEIAQFDPELIDGFAKAAKDLGYGTKAVAIAHNGLNGALVSIGDDPSFVGVVMPVRNAPALAAPAWVHAVASDTEEKRAA